MPGANTIEEAEALQQKIIDILNEENMPIRKWTLNEQWWFETNGQSNHTYEIHGFADAPEKANAAVVYLKTI